MADYTYTPPEIAGILPADDSGMVAFARVAKRRDSAGEFRIFAYDASGQRLPAADCWETDRAAALATAREMVKPYLRECQEQLGESLIVSANFRPDFD